MTVREVVIFAWLVYAVLWRGYLAAAETNHILRGSSMDVVCRSQTALGCLGLHMWMLLGVVMRWGSYAVPWGVVAVAVAFMGEEVGRAVPTKG
jgi:hypothetical protein